MSTSELEEDLRVISELAPRLAGEAREATEAAAAVEAAASPLRDEIRALAEDAQAAASVADSLGQAFAKHVNELEQHLRTVVGEARQSWDPANQAIVAAIPPVWRSAANLTQAKDAMVDGLMAAGTEMDPTSEAETATRNLSDTSAKAQADLEREAGDLATALTAFQETLSDRVPRLNTAAEALIRRIDELHNRLEKQAGTLVTAMAAKAAEFEQALRASLALLATEYESQLELMTDRLPEQVGRPLEEAGDSARQALAALGTGAAERDRALVAARAEFVQAFADLEAAARPLPPAIEDIHAAFEQIDGA